MSGHDKYDHVKETKKEGCWEGDYLSHLFHPAGGRFRGTGGV
jgi:hypothetical protein